MLGVFQGFWWASLQPWDVSIEGSMPFWIFRAFTGLAMFAGLLVFLYNIYKTWQVARGQGQTSAAAA
jgi:cytochrome c oxidase cbb3-type subunit 1